MQFLFDLDGTLTSEEILPRIAREFGISSDIEQLTKATIEGEISFKESFELRVDMLSHIPHVEVAEVVLGVPINSRIVEWAQRNRSNSMVVTGNLDLWIQPWLDRYGLRGLSSTGSVVAGQVQVERVMAKEAVVKEAKMKGQVVFIGDGANDAGAFEAADFSIAFGGVHHPAPILFDLANAIATEEGALCRVLSRLLSRQPV